MGLPRKRNYSGRWDALIEKSTKCLNRMLEIASRKKRNYIIDQVGPCPCTTTYEWATQSRAILGWRGERYRKFNGWPLTAEVVICCCNVIVAMETSPWSCRLQKWHHYPVETCYNIFEEWGRMEIFTTPVVSCFSSFACNVDSSIENVYFLPRGAWEECRVELYSCCDWPRWLGVGWGKHPSRSPVFSVSTSNCSLWQKFLVQPVVTR